MGYENFEIKKRKTYEKYTYIYIYIYIAYGSLWHSPPIRPSKKILPKHFL